MLVEITSYALAVLVSVPLLVLSLQCFLAILPARKFKRGARRNCAVLIPAHDEEAGISSTLDNVRGQLAAHDRLVVVADNCSDRTAEIAREHGAETVVRNDPDNRGKGFALQAGIQYLAEGQSEIQPFTEVVVILDADCALAEGALEELVCAVERGGGPVQAQYLMHAPAEAGVSTRVSAFAFLTKNLIRARGLARLGLPVPLTGSGMAFPWEVICDVPLGSSEIVEDLDLGLRLVMDGKGPRFCELARVDSYFPTNAQAQKQQRTRWEHGFVGQMRTKIPPLLLQSLRGDPHAFSSALDLMIPPLSLLAMVSTATGLFLAVQAVWGGSRLPLYLFLVSCSLASLGLFFAWLVFGRRALPFVEVLSIPKYILGKFSIYLQIPFRSEREWKRTER